MFTVKPNQTFKRPNPNQVKKPVAPQKKEVLTPQEQMLRPLNHIWNNGTLKLKFQLVNPTKEESLDLLLRFFELKREDIKPDKLIILQAWILSKEWALPV